MIGYQEFMGRESQQTPFRDRKEEINVHLGWVDLLLFSYEYVRKREKQDDEEIERIREAAKEEVKKGLYILKKRQEVSRYDGWEYGIGGVAEEFHLDEVGWITFLLALAPQFDEYYLSLYAGLYEEGEGGRGLNLFLVRRLYGLLLTAEERLHTNLGHALTDCPLFRLYYTEGDDSFLKGRIVLQKEIVSLIQGEILLPKEIAELCFQADQAVLQTEPLSGLEIYGQLKTLLRTLPEGGKKELIHVTGKRGAGKKFLLTHACGSDRLYFIDVGGLLQKEGKKAGELLQRIFLRCRVQHYLPVFYEREREEIDSTQILLIGKDAFKLLNRVVFLSREAKNIDLLAEHFSYIHLSVPEGKGKERQRIWKHYLEGTALEEELSIDVLASTYRFSPGMIVNCIEQAKIIARAKGDPAIGRSHLQQAAAHFHSSQLSQLATHIQPHFTWADLVIDPQQKQILQLACARAGLRSLVDEEWGFEQKISYGRGISVLLYGPPGTGKTMAAQIMAKEIGMELYRIDLSQIVDKYIGETQKNIGRIFASAREGNFLLFFDEADALFSKRTEVQNANDKHANTEINYLLQKMEEYEGMTILTTNRFDHFDAAFVRRITYTVHLERPNEEERLRLFKTILPGQAKVDEELDFPFFAKQFELTGSNIKAVLYNAAFMAAAEKRGIRNGDLAKAIKYESTKLGKIIMANEFGSYASFV